MQTTRDPQAREQATEEFTQIIEAPTSNRHAHSRYAEPAHPGTVSCRLRRDGEPFGKLSGSYTILELSKWKPWSYARTIAAWTPPVDADDLQTPASTSARPESDTPVAITARNATFPGVVGKRTGEHYSGY